MPEPNKPEPKMDSATGTGPSNSTWRLAWVLGTIAILFIGWSFWAGRLPGTPFKLQRDASGKLVPVTTDRFDDTSGTTANLSAASLDASNATISSHSVSHSDNAGFHCRRVAIMNYSDHPLAAQVGKALPDQLAKLNFVEAVEYYPAGSAPPVGSQSPDHWITLDLGNLVTSGIMPRLGIEAAITVTAGSTIAKGQYSMHDSSSPPIVTGLWKATIKHKSTMTGFATDKFSLVARNISEQLGEQVTEHLQTMHDKFGPAPAFHADFYPGYTSTPPQLTFDDWGAEQITSTHGLMFRNETFWRITTTDSVVSLLTDVQSRFEQDGWKTGHFTASDASCHLAMTRAEDRLDMFPIRDAYSPSPSATGDGDGTSAAKPTTVVVHYVDRLSRSELQAAAGRQLAQEGPLQSLAALASFFSPAQRVRYVELLETEDSNSAWVWRTLANQYSNMKQIDKSRAALRKAHWLSKFDPATNDQHAAIKNLAKRLKMEDVLKENMSVDLIREFGIPELTLNEATTPVVVGLDQPAFFYAVDGKGAWHLLNWRVRQDGYPPEHSNYKLTFAHLTKGSSSWGSGTSLPTTDATMNAVTLPEFGKVKLKVEILADERARFVGQVEPN